MKETLFIFLVIAAIFECCKATDLQVGTTTNNKLIWQHKLSYGAFPFKKGIKEVFYSNPDLKPIKAVIARDMAHSAASAIITSGGVGSYYVNVRLKSERGGALKYNVEIYI